MRVIAGSAKGRRLKAPTTGTRPMTDRMKESLFSAIGDVDRKSVLDLYAGSGSLGLEALSRGADKATFVESARDAIVKLRENVEATGLEDRSEVVWSDVQQVLMRHPDDRIDLIFLDPPYSTPPDSVLRDLESLVTGGFLADEGFVVLHRPARERSHKPFGLQCIWEREYGQSALYIFRHEDDEDAT
jgi:16S rRNA (guanine966-N2)-methyltransferase